LFKHKHLLGYRCISTQRSNNHDLARLRRYRNRRSWSTITLASLTANHHIHQVVRDMRSASKLKPSDLYVQKKKTIQPIQIPVINPAWTRHPLLHHPRLLLVSSDSIPQSSYPYLPLFSFLQIYPVVLPTCSLQLL
jgi:hypothetical protein